MNARIQPTASEARTTAKTLRWLAWRLESESSWWNRWTYPVRTLREYAAKFEDLADTLERAE